MLRSTALLGFILTGIGSQLPWFRWEMVIGGRGEAIFEVSAIDMAERGETLLFFSVVGGAVIWFATRATPLTIPVLAAAMSLIVVLYTYNNPYPPPDDMDALQGFYLTLAGTVIALGASTMLFLESFSWFPRAGPSEPFDPGP